MAAAQLAAAVAASIPPVAVPNRPANVAATGNVSYEVEDWSDFRQIVCAPFRSLAVQTERVHVLTAPMVQYHASTQTMCTMAAVAVGVNIPDRP